MSRIAKAGSNATVDGRDWRQAYVSGQLYIEKVKQHYRTTPTTISTFHSLLSSFNRTRLTHNQLYILLYALFHTTDSLHLFDGSRVFLPLYAAADLEWLHTAIRTARYDVDSWDWICEKAGLQRVERVGVDDCGKAMATWREDCSEERETRYLLGGILTDTVETGGEAGRAHRFVFAVPGREERSASVRSLDSTETSSAETHETGTSRAEKFGGADERFGMDVERAAQKATVSAEKGTSFKTSEEGMLAIFASLADLGDRVMRAETLRGPSFSPCADRGGTPETGPTSRVASRTLRGLSEVSSVLSFMPDSVGPLDALLPSSDVSDFPVEIASSLDMDMGTSQDSGEAYVKPHGIAKKRETRRTADSLTKSIVPHAGQRSTPLSKVTKSTTATKQTVEKTSPEPGSVPERSAYQAELLRRRAPAATVPFVGPIFLTRRAVFARDSKPYIHAICGRAFRHPDDVKGHHGMSGRGKGCRQGTRKWDEHESCGATESTVKIRAVREGYVVVDQESWDLLQRCSEPGVEASSDDIDDASDIDWEG